MKINFFATLAVTLSILAFASAQGTGEGITSSSSGPVTAQRNQPQKMTISRRGARASSPGPEANFTGKATIEALFMSNAPARTSGASVTFEPAARTAWHSHPLGQTLIVTSGTGWLQQEGGEKQEIRQGDVVWTPPGVKHWHGATTTSGMAHIAIQEALDGKVVEWMDKVTDEQYAR